MASRMILICDRCGATCLLDSIWVVVGEQRLPTGETEECTEALDLCHSCLRWTVEDLFRRNPNYEARKELLSILKQPKKVERM